MGGTLTSDESALEAGLSLTSVFSLVAGLAAFAARHSSGGAVDVVLVNESLTASAQVALSIAGAPDRQAVEHLLAGGSSVIELRSIPSLGQSITLPPLSVALIEVPKS